MADPTERVLILIVAFGIEAVLAYPARLFRAIGHPVSWIGASEAVFFVVCQRLCNELSVGLIEWLVAFR